MRPDRIPVLAVVRVGGRWEALQGRRQGDRVKRLAMAALTVLTAIAVLVLGGLPAQAVDDVGFVGPVYGTTTTAPTGQKPQSKLWVADGIWWGSLYDRTSGDFHIFRYDRTANTWTDTGVLVDERPNIYMDTLWDGQHLYVVGAGANPATVNHALRVTRFSYSAASQTWSRDSGYPVTPLGSGGVKSPVVDKDSTGMLWVTFFTGSKIWVSHSLPGDDRTWVPRYQLPTPADQSSVGADDLSALVAFDGDKIGVLWSNQLSTSETMYWSWHQDGTSDQEWNLQVAYQQPEGADDHINLKSLVGDSAGRVFAVAKTSMDASSDPLFNLLTLSLSGQWSSDVVWTQADDSTRAIVQIDRTNREVYVFAAAPCCAGGTIYMKKAALDNPQFSSGLGTPFIHSAAHPEANNPTSTKQTVTADTGLVVMASDDETRTYLYNRLDLDGAPPTDTTPPETTVTTAPPTSTGSTDATFEFSSNESGSTFTCSLDGAPAESCTSPQAYTGLAVGNHTFTVAATDAAGNTDPTPATHSWAVVGDTSPPETTITTAPPASTGSTDATFEFSSNESGSTFTCSLDGAPAESCTSPQAYTDLAVGNHTFTVAATDAAGNTDPTPATHSWAVVGDTSPPETTITTAPPASTGSTDATFEFSSNESGSTFTCSLDGAPAESCTSPQAYTDLAVGNHTFTVAATDAAGNTDPTPATHSWAAGATTVFFNDDFSSGGFTAGGWQVQAGGGGTATVVSGAVRPSDLGARLLSTTAKDSTASLRRAIPASGSLVVEWDALVASVGKQPIALTKLYSASGRMLTLTRNRSGALSLQDTTATVSTAAIVPTGQVVRLRLSVTSGTAGRVRLAVNGTEVFSATMNVGTTPFNAVRMGDDAKRHAFDYRVDNVQLAQ